MRGCRCEVQRVEERQGALEPAHQSLQARLKVEQVPIHIYFDYAGRGIQAMPDDGSRAIGDRTDPVAQLKEVFGVGIGHTIR